MFDLSRFDIISFDTETTGLVWPKDRMFGFSLAAPDGQSCYHDIRIEPESIDQLNEELQYYKGEITCHNAPFDYKMAYSAGIELPLDRMDDTVIRASLINEHEMSYSLDALCEKYLGEKKESEIYEELAKLFGGRATRNVQIKNISRAPASVVAPYAIKDAELALQLWQWQKQEIERQGIERIVAFERRVQTPIIKASMRGIRIDEDAAERAIKDVTVEIDRQQAELNDLVGFDINVDSPKQIKQVFEPEKDEFGDWKTKFGHSLEATDAGNPSIDAEALREMEGNRIAELILELRSAVKTRDTFLAGHVLGHSYEGRVYPNINQLKGEDAGTGTGRLSYSDPAMQQVPSRNKRIAQIVKSCFLPNEGCRWLSLDMNSFEVRVFAHLVNNEDILRKYAEDEKIDFHQMVADMTGLVRNATYSGQPNAKQLNLSMIFNSGNGAIAAKMGMPWEPAAFKKKGKIFRYKKAGPEAEAVIDDYHRKLPGIKQLANRAKRAAEEYGYVETKHGRRLRFPYKDKSYKASGLAIQATSADINKEMWLLCDEMEAVTGAHLILNTHDSYEINLPEDVDPLILRQELQDCIRAKIPWFRVPLIIDMNGVGISYWDSQ